MKVLMYLLYGDNNKYWQEAKFSILTAWRFINQEAPGFKIVVCTDQPEQINGYPVTVQHFDAEKLKEWAGPLAYFHRAKNRAMAEVMDKYSSPTVFVDSDTYFKKSPELLFARIGPGRAVMHKSEGLIVEKHNSPVRHLQSLVFPDPWGGTYTHDSLARHLQGLIFPDPWGGTYTFSPQAEMWNSGIVGLHPTNRPLLDRSLWLLDELYWRTKIFNVEQFSLAEVLRSETKLHQSADIVVHYWHFLRPFFHQKLNRFFSERRDAPFDTLVADSVDVAKPILNNSLTERVIIHLKSQRCGWSPLYKAACSAVLSGTVRRKKAGMSDEVVQAVWRQYALTWLEDELVVCEKDLHAGRLSALLLRKKLEHWRKDKDLAAVREPEGLAKFAESEKKKWADFWHKVDKFLVTIDSGAL